MTERKWSQVRRDIEWHGLEGWSMFWVEDYWAYFNNGGWV